MNLNRRNFMGSSVAAVAAGMSAGRNVLGANERIGICHIGIHGRGAGHIREVMKRSDTEIVALCDVDSKVLDQGAASVKGATGKEPKKYTDIRQALEDKNVNVITIATPNHWHSLAAIWGCMAGKDVYVEKPLSHSIWEGRQLVAVAKKYGRVVQHGTQSRSNSILLRDMRLIHQGFIGPISHSRGYVYKNGNRQSIGRGKPGPPPQNLNWPLWQGPAEEKPYLLKENGEGLLVHYNWHWVWEYGNGEIGNQGAHEMDMACWGHNRGLPVKVQSMGGRYAWDDDGQTPNTQSTTYIYGDGSMLTFEVRNLGSFYEGGGGANSNSFFGTKGYYVRGVGFFDYSNKPIEVKEPKADEASPWDRFFKVVRSRQEGDNPCNAEVGHISCVHCHLGNIAYRLGQTLQFDPKTEKFIGSAEANQLVTRPYRKGFEVPPIT